MVTVRRHICCFFKPPKTCQHIRCCQHIGCFVTISDGSRISGRFRAFYLYWGRLRILILKNSHKNKLTKNTNYKFEEKYKSFNLKQEIIRLCCQDLQKQPEYAEDSEIQSLKFSDFFITAFMKNHLFRHILECKK